VQKPGDEAPAIPLRVECQVLVDQVDAVGQLREL
jgi:hypothetical protein